MQKYLSSDFTETHPKDAPEEEGTMELCLTDAHHRLK